jgi:hypothetical protein
MLKPSGETKWTVSGRNSKKFLTTEVSQRICGSLQAYHPEPSYIYLVWISDKRPARALALGFEMEWTPKNATLLVGNQAAFEKCFTHKAHAA